MRRRAFIALGLGGLLLAGCGGSSGGGSMPTAARQPSASSLAPLHGAYSPRSSPPNFVTTIDNRYWPLKPGTGLPLRGRAWHDAADRRRGRHPPDEDDPGHPLTVVRDTVSEHGMPVERTFDWYAQDRQGNVWYMGELSLEKKNGRFARASDSWQSGVKGAQPGIIMPANPRPGDAYRQEYYPPGEALDQARVLRLDGSVSVPLRHLPRRARHKRVQPAGAPDRAEVLRTGPR